MIFSPSLERFLAAVLSLFLASVMQSSVLSSWNSAATFLIFLLSGPAAPGIQSLFCSIAISSRLKVFLVDVVDEVVRLHAVKPASRPSSPCN